MRTLDVKKGASVTAIAERLVGTDATPARKAAVVAELGALNPHLDLGQIDDNIVLIVPDATAGQADTGTSPAAAPLAALRKLADDGFDTVTARLRAAAADRAANRTAVTAVFKAAAFKRVTEADPTLAAQRDAAQKALNDDQAADKAAQDTIAALAKAASAAFADLAKLVG